MGLYIKLERFSSENRVTLFGNRSDYSGAAFGEDMF